MNRPWALFLRTYFWKPHLYAYILFGVLFSFFTGVLIHNTILLYALDGILFFPVFAFHVHQWEIGRLFRVASFWGIFKSVLFIAGVIVFNGAIDDIVDQGPAYHSETLNWILTGEGVIAHPEEFIPRHIDGAFRVVVSTVGSCGLTTLIGGSRELNVMNFHVAKLIQGSAIPGRMLFVGWPIWSLLRGWSYLSLMVGSANLFFVIIRQHTFKWRSFVPYMLFGLLGVTADVVLKVLFAPQWRIILLNSLRG